MRLIMTITDWDDLPDSLITSAEMSIDCVSKFTLPRALDAILSFWRCTSKLIRFFLMEGGLS